LFEGQKSVEVNEIDQCREVKRSMRESPISSVDWERAIYIDFESRVRDPESILGVACDGSWYVYILERTLWSAKPYGHPRGSVEALPVLEAISVIRERAIAERRIVAAWSSREKDGILKSPGISQSEANWWDLNLIDAKISAKRMARALSINIRPRKSIMGKGINRSPLASFFEATNYEVPHVHGPGNAAKRILYVRNQIEAKGSFDLITRAAKTKWTNGLSHNYHDCVGLGHVMRTLSLRYEAKFGRPLS